MAKLPPIKRLLLQDFVSQSQWIGGLLQNLNAFMDNVYGALNQTLTLTDNSTGALLSVTLTQLPSSTAPVKVQWTKPSIPTAVLIGSVVQRTVALSNSMTTSGTVLTAAPGLEWQFVSNSTGNYIYITNTVGFPTPTTAVTIDLQLVVFTG